jgi:integrase
VTALESLVGYDPLRDLRHREAAAARELSDWLRWLEVGNKSPRTLDAYERTVAALLLAFPAQRFDEFTDGDLLHALALFPAKSRHLNKSHLNSWFKWGLRTRRIVHNPVDLLPDMNYKPPRDYDLFSDTEADAVCALPAPDGQLATILFWTGIRLAEARALTGKRLDFERKQVLIVDGSKGKKTRRVPMVDRAFAASLDLVTLEGIGPDDYLWYTKDGGSKRLRHGRMVSDQRFYDWWKLTLGHAGVRYRKPHLARHSFATRMKKLGLPVEELAQILGHESIRTTIDTYVHQPTDLIGEHMRELVGG